MDNFTSKVKIIVIQNSIADIIDLNQVKVKYVHGVVNGGRTLKFGLYKSLLLYA